MITESGDQVQAQRFAQDLSGAYGPYRVEFTAEALPGAVQLNGEIFHGDRRIGEIERIFIRDETGELVAHHNEIKIEVKELRGRASPRPSYPSSTSTTPAPGSTASSYWRCRTVRTRGPDEDSPGICALTNFKTRSTRSRLRHNVCQVRSAPRPRWSSKRSSRDWSRGIPGYRSLRTSRTSVPRAPGAWARAAAPIDLVRDQICRRSAALPVTR